MFEGSDVYTREEAIEDSLNMHADGIPMLLSETSYQGMFQIKYAVITDSEGEEFIHPAYSWSPQLQALIDRDADLSFELWLKKNGLQPLF